ncbi:MAG: hypothetical protein GY696_00835, partial [Gammaproteobacteria bacterium]|nr:hypothetical protein [Gammaproteobacteria bacterium]
MNLVSALEAAKKLLSQQNHYDFKLRTAKAVVDACKLLKTETGQEPILTAQALRAVNMPQLTSGDAEIFRKLTTNFFCVESVEKNFSDTSVNLKDA